MERAFAFAFCFFWVGRSAYILKTSFHFLATKNMQFCLQQTRSTSNNNIIVLYFSDFTSIPSCSVYVYHYFLPSLVFVHPNSIHTYIHSFSECTDRYYFLAIALISINSEYFDRR